MDMLVVKAKRYDEGKPVISYLGEDRNNGPLSSGLPCWYDATVHNWDFRGIKRFATIEDILDWIEENETLLHEVHLFRGVIGELKIVKISAHELATTICREIFEEK